MIATQHYLPKILLIAAAFFSGNAAAIKYSFTSFDLPDQTYTVAGINDAGQIVGYYHDTSLDRNRVFILNAGTYTKISTPPPGVGENWDIWSQGINNHGMVVGGYLSGETGNQGFTYGVGSGYQAITVPGSSWNYALAINDKGQVVGTSDAIANRGFIESGGIYTPLDDPTPTTSSNVAVGLNNNGKILGGYDDATGSYTYVKNSDGSYTILPKMHLIGWDNDFNPTPVGINNNDEVLVYFQDSGYSFVFRDGQYTQIIHPKACCTGTKTHSAGINNIGQIAGTYYDGTIYHGFIATPVVTGFAIDKAWITPTKVNQGEDINIYAQISGDRNKIGKVVFVLGSTELTTLTDPDGDGTWFGQHQAIESPGYKASTKIYVKNLKGA